MKKVLITGANGFVGQNIMDKLKTDFDVYGFDRVKVEGLDSEHQFIGELKDFSMLATIFSNIKPDILIHLAAIVHKNNADTSEKNYNFINFECSKKLFELCKEFNTNVLYASTIEVYGENDLNIVNEYTECNPTSYYAISKYKAECFLKESGLRYTILRFTPLYGEKFTLNIDKRVFIKKDKIAYYFKKGNYTFNFCSIKNVNDKIYNSCINGFDNKIHIMADNDSFCVKEIIKLYKENGRVKFTLHLPYYLCYTVISLMNMLTLLMKKDAYFSLRNFKKLFESKTYADTEYNDNTWDINSTVFKKK